MRAQLWGLLVLLGVAGCDDMSNQPRQKAYSPAPSPVSMPVGTVEANARTEPVPSVTYQLLERGQQRYRIFCTPCHAETGDGHGMVVQRGFPAPPSFHSDRLRAEPVQHFYDVITQGYGVMYSFADRIAPADRWAIAAYLRALQRSQNASSPP